jgi:hypothetical protein
MGRGLEVFRTLVEELALGVDDGADHARDRALALLDRLDQPARVADVVHQEFAACLSPFFSLTNLRHIPLM